MANHILTADLCDAFEDELRVAAPVFNSYGGKPRFGGPVRTVRCYDDNTRVSEAVRGAGDGHVLVVDGGGSLRCALLGGNLGELAAGNGWSGILVNGCIRDRLEIDALPIGVRALACVPRRSEKRGTGETAVRVHFAGIDIAPGDYLYADEDGIVVATRDLANPTGGT